MICWRIDEKKPKLSHAHKPLRSTTTNKAWCLRFFYFFIQYRPPALLKIHITPLCFQERPTLVPLFTNWKKSEEDLHFKEKGRKLKTVFCLDTFGSEAYKVSLHQTTRVAMGSSFHRNHHTQHLGSRPAPLCTGSVSIRASRPLILCIR